MKRILVFAVLAAFVFLSCATLNQNNSKDQDQDLGQDHNKAHNQNQEKEKDKNPINISHWIVGTWTQEGGTVWVFNANGTGTAGKEKFIYGIFSGSEIYLSNGWGARKIFLSPDGRKMIIMGIVFNRND